MPPPSLKILLDGALVEAAMAPAAKLGSGRVKGVRTFTPVRAVRVRRCRLLARESLAADVAVERSSL